MATRIELDKAHVTDCINSAIRIFQRGARNAADIQIAKIHKENADRLTKALLTITDIK